VSEYVEEFEDDEDDVLNEIEDLRETIERQAQIDAADRALQQLERQHGSRFTAEEVQEMGELLLDGYDPQSVYEHVSPSTPFEDQFEDSLERVERITERPLVESEVDAFWKQASTGQEMDSDSLLDLDDARQRKEYASQRLTEVDQAGKPEPPETVDELPLDASAEDRKSYMEARAAGAEIEGETE
jgi:hypothetical protein